MERKRERRKGKLLNLVFSAFFFLIYHFLHLELPQQTKKFEAFSDKGGGVRGGVVGQRGCDA